MKTSSTRNTAVSFEARDVVALPKNIIEAVGKAREDASLQASSAEGSGNAAEAARLSALSLLLQEAEDAARLAEDGLLERARQKFVGLVSQTPDTNILCLAYEFFYRTDDLAGALDTLERYLSVSDQKSFGGAGIPSDRASLRNRLGGKDRAEEMYQKAMAIDEALGRKEGVARQYARLAHLYRDRGDLGRAEGMCRKSLAVNEALGCKEGAARQYGNLGILYKTMGDLDLAEEMYRKAIAIDETLGRKEGVARQYGNLGILYKTRGNLDRAEEMYQKAIAIDETLGRREDVARQYAKLASLYKDRGDLDRAEGMYYKSVELFNVLHSSSPEGVNQFPVNLQNR
ncbi:MAG TPA: tetratricopeptide repeat protein [Syntrophorhabdaceae bacterium]|jgi:tetratricopeptide (TPR) repeat protein